MCRDPHRRQRRDGVGLPVRIPGRPAARMEPSLAGAFDPVGQQRIMGMIAPASASMPRPVV